MRYIVSEPGAVATGSTGKFENKHNPVSITLAMARSHPPPPCGLDPNEIEKVRVVMTIMNGRVVYER